MPSLNRRHQASELLRQAAKMRLERLAAARAAPALPAAEVRTGAVGGQWCVGCQTYPPSVQERAAARDHRATGGHERREGSYGAAFPVVPDVRVNDRVRDYHVDVGDRAKANQDVVIVRDRWNERYRWRCKLFFLERLDPLFKLRRW
jgi:hypothetical protein